MKFFTLPDFNMLTNPTLNPFESIGLCFSGGGYRASAFSLGILS